MSIQWRGPRERAVIKSWLLRKEIGETQAERGGDPLPRTAGEGRVQHWGDRVEAIRAGDVVWIPPAVKHWHGAGPTTRMTHTAIQEHAGRKNVEWLERVTDEQYNAR